MSYIVMGFVILFLFIAIVFKGYLDDKKRREYLINKVKDNFDKKSSRDYSKDEFENIKHYFEVNKGEDYIDDITANDLNLDDIYKELNHSLSAPGDEIFYLKLRKPEYDISKLKEVDELSNAINADTNIKEALLVYFLSVGKLHKISFYEFVELIDSVKGKKPVKEIFFLLVFALSIFVITFDVPIGIFILVAAIVVNILDYYKERGKIESYIIGLSYAVNLINVSLKVPEIKNASIEEKISLIRSRAKELKHITRFYNLIAGANKSIGAGNPLDIFVDYLRMFFHLDIIRFYQVLSSIQAEKNTISALYNDIGELEFYLNVASIKKIYSDYCVPQFIMQDEGNGSSYNKNITDGIYVSDNSYFIKGENIYHPLINDPVKNSFEQKGGFLITGSNASGKSTFLRSIAVNILFSETLYLALADNFTLPMVKLMTSISVSDNIMSGDSYFMAEIKSLKRIFDYLKTNSRRLCVFTDELLRGTNTIERISAVSKILESLINENALVFSATHDIELTEILKNQYDNYHFDEEIIDDDVIFNYLIKPGKATSKNAIKLLGLMGFDDKLVDEAKDMSDRFIQNGVWN